MPSFAALKEHPLVGQCFMWCMMKGLEPLTNGNETFLMMAIYDYTGDFGTLNENQRRLIAGFAR